MEGNKAAKRAGIAIGMTLFGALLALILIEGFLTYILPQPDDFYHYEPNAGWIHIPGKEGKWVKKEFAIKVKINSEGFRDSEWKVEKDPEEFRIAVIGDSYVEGFQVPLEETVTEVLEDMLNSNSDRRYEVMNFGVAGYSTSQEYIILKSRVLKYNPDLVILVFSSNDVRFNSLELSDDRFRPYFSVENGKLTQTKSPAEQPHSSLKTVFRNLFPKTYHFLSTAVGENPSVKSILVKLGIISADYNSTYKKKSENIPTDYYVYSSEYDQNWLKAWNITKELILAIKSEAEGNNAKFLLVIGASREQVHPDWWEEVLDSYPDMRDLEWNLEKPNKILEDFSFENDIECVNLLPAFIESAEKTGRKLFYHYDGHWNEYGHRIAAEQIYDKIEKII